MTEDRTHDQELKEIVHEEVRGALDPENFIESTKALTEELKHLAGGPGQLNEVLSELNKWTTESERLISSAAEAHVCLTRRGWGLSMLPEEEVQKAVKLYLVNEEAKGDQVLISCFDETLLRTIVNVVGAIGRRDAALRAYFGQRRRLLDKAKDHHIHRRYDASVPILLAQIEGLVVDLSDGKTFFSKSRTRKAPVDAPGILAGIEHGLPALRDLFSEGVTTTGSEGRLSRHGILHGRELAYDTELVSSKCWSLLAVVAEWGRLVGNQVAEARNTEHLKKHAEILGTDEAGAQLDRREFRTTMNIIFNMSSVLMVRHRAFGKVEPGDLAKFQPGVGSMKLLEENPKFKYHFGDDGHSAAIWRKTITGVTLGYFVEWSSGESQEFYYSSGSDPAFEQLGAKPAWSVFEENADWTSSNP